MTLGLSPDAFLILHVAISMAAIFAGFIVLGGLYSSAKLPGWTAVFLVLTILTSVTGFMFPFAGITPAFVLGALSIVVLAIALIALYSRKMKGRWRWVYVTSAVLALYLNVFVFIVQSFQKVGFLQALAPTQAEPAFAIAQAAVLGLFVVLGWLAVSRFHPERVAP
jgi:hypothetical protein